MAVVSGRLDTFERDIRVATAGMDAKAAAAELARFARAELAAAIASGQASENFERYVNGRQGLSEDAVIPPGPIIYVFTHWAFIIRTALEELRKRVPVRSGRYAGGFIVLANGVPVTDYASIDPDHEVVILNVKPYTRKMEVGALAGRLRSNGPGEGHFRKTRNVLNRRFSGAFVCQDRFLNVSAGLAAGVPYILKHHGLVGPRGRTRRDRYAGMPITYPALVINSVR